MFPTLYLDTARLGQMSPAAQRTLHDFARFAGEAGGSIHLEDLLWRGTQSLPSGFCDRYPGLSEWQGVSALKESLCHLARMPAGTQVLLAARSAQLMKLAATLLCRPCRNILITDLGWSPYHEILVRECRRTNRKATLIGLSDQIFRGDIDDDDVTSLIAEAYQRNRCDGLFLTAVNNLGIRLPVRKIVRTIEKSAELRFVALDGAQDIGHTGPDSGIDCADLYLAGAHKWLGAYVPLGMAFYHQLRSRGMVDAVLRDSLANRLIDDPLLRFVERLQGDIQETVNLSAFFSAQGAVNDASRPNALPGALLPDRLKNAETTSSAALTLDWQPQMPHSSLRSGILLLQAGPAKTRSLSPKLLRSQFHKSGIELTAYEQGLVRLSLPASKLELAELDWLRAALQNVA